MEAPCPARKPGPQLRERKTCAPLWLAASLVAVFACGDSSDPEVVQDASMVVADGGVGSGVPVPPGASGGMQGGGLPGAGGGTTGGGTMGGSGGMPGMTGMNPARPDAGRPDAGRPANDAGAMSADSGVMMPVGDGGDPFAEVRQVCVDTINMYRATLSLPPLARADATLEACSDMGAKYDGDMNMGHASTRVPGKGRNGATGRLCGSPPLGRQDTCPNWSVGARTGNATLADALKKCLAQMWAEGMPPVPVAQCEMDQAAGGCFLTHGHWINMTANSTAVSCGFYDMGGGKYWMNQDFAAGR